LFFGLAPFLRFHFLILALGFGPGPGLVSAFGLASGILSTLSCFLAMDFFQEVGNQWLFSFASSSFFCFRRLDFWLWHVDQEMEGKSSQLNTVQYSTVQYSTVQYSTTV
jgi:hypothetical protein